MKGCKPSGYAKTGMEATEAIDIIFRVYRRLGRGSAIAKAAWLATGLGLAVATGSASAVSPYIKSQRDQVVFVGDSITFGQGSSDPATKSRPALFEQRFGTKVDVVNKGINGITLGSIAGINDIGAIKRPGVRNVAIVLAGSNDLEQGDKAPALYGTLRTYVTGLKASGWKVAVGTILARHFPPDKERERLALNAMIKSGEIAAAGIVVIDYARAQDKGGIPLADPVHPDDTGFVTMAALERPVILRLLRSK